MRNFQNNMNRNNNQNTGNNNRNRNNVGKRPIENYVSVRDHVELKKMFVKYTATMDLLVNEKFGFRISDFASKMTVDMKEQLQGSKLHDTFNILKDEINNATQVTDETQNQRPYKIKKCWVESCRKHFISFKKFANIQDFCDRCRSVKTTVKKCCKCDIKFRPIYNWSNKCRHCSCIDSRVHKKCSKCLKLFRQKIYGQIDCKSCIEPKIGMRVCQKCSTPFFPTFIFSKNCAICLHDSLLTQSRF